MTREERQKKINAMADSCTQEDKEYCRSEVNKWCKGCDDYYKNTYTIEVVKALGNKVFLSAIADNAKCNNLLNKDKLSKEQFIHNQILRGIVRRLCKAEYLLTQGKEVTSI